MLTTKGSPSKSGQNDVVDDFGSPIVRENLKEDETGDSACRAGGARITSWRRRSGMHMYSGCLRLTGVTGGPLAVSAK